VPDRLPVYQLPVLSARELTRFDAPLTSEVNEIDQPKDHLTVSQRSLDVDTMPHIQKITRQQEAEPHWHLILAAVSCMLTMLLNFGIFLRSKLQCATSRGPRADKSTNATLGSSNHPVPVSENPTATVYSEPQFENITFATKALKGKD
jgi:hypothetical protein